MSDFVPSQTGQPPGMNLFAPDEPPAYLNIGKVKFVFGCGGSKYTFTHDSEPSLGGTTTPTFTDTAWPCSPLGGDPENKDALDALTRVWAIEFLEWFKIQFDYTFAGVCAIEPNGFIDEMEIDYTPDMVSTRIRSGPWNGYPLALGHEDPDCQSPPSGNMFIGVVTEKITAASSIVPTDPGDEPSGAAFGHGKVQLFFPGEGGASDYAGKPVLTNNWFPTEIPVDSRVTVAKIDCQLFIVSASCAGATASSPTGGGIPNPDTDEMSNINFFS